MTRLLLIIVAAVIVSAAGKPGRVIRVPVWADARENAPAEPLTVRDVAARLDGAAAPVRAVLGPETDVMILLVTDVVGDISLVKPAKESLISELGNLPPNVHVGLMRAQDGLKVLLDPSTDREKISAAVEALPVSGRPGLLDSVVTASKVADAILAQHAIRAAVFYVTDSDISEYREDFTNPVVNYSDPRDMSRRFPDVLVREKISRLDGSLAALQVPLFIVHLYYRSERLNEAYQSGLRQLAATTGGRSAFCRSAAEIPKAIGDMLRSILSCHRVDVDLPANVPKTVQLQLESTGRSLSYRQRFFLDGR